MSIERPGAVTLGGRPLTVIGEALEVGQQAPDFQLIANNYSRVTMADFAGKTRLISVVPSLDTSVCAVQTRRFNQEATALGDDVIVLTISVDMPGAQARWCGSEGVDRIQTLSDHFDMNFGIAYGTYIKEIRQEQRSVFVVDAEGNITYIEYVPEVGQEPDYEAAVAAVKAAQK